MATKTAIWNPREQLLDHERTKKWPLPSSGRSLDLRVTASPARERGSQPGQYKRVLGTNPAGDSYLPSWPITSSKWSKKYQSTLLDARPEWQDTRSLSQTECQFGKLSFFKSAANRGSLCKLFSSGSIFVDIRLGSRCA